MKSKIRIKTLAGVLFICVAAYGVCGRSINVMAASGSGSGGSAVSGYGCDNVETAMIRLCCDEKDKNNPEKCLGGASWVMFKTGGSHIEGVYSGYKLYKTDQNGSGSYKWGPRHCKTLSDQNNTKSCSSPAILSGKEYDKKLATRCPSSKYDYYLAYTAVGWNGPKQKNAPTYWGPAGWNLPIKTSHGNKSITQNTAGQHTFNEVEAGLKNNTNMEGWKVNSGVAKKFCKLDDAGDCKAVTTNTLKDGVGYICVEWDVTLSATAILVDENGKWVKDLKENINKATGKTGKVDTAVNLTVNSSSYTNKDSVKKKYEFVGWSDSKKTINIKDTKSKYTKGIKKDTTVYAVYKSGSPSTCTDPCCPGDPGYPDCPVSACDESDPYYPTCEPPEPGECSAVPDFRAASGEVATGTWVKNNSVSEFDSWHTGDSNPVWAKPEDEIEWANCYNSEIVSRKDETSTYWNTDPGHPSTLPGNVNSPNNMAVGDWYPWSNNWTVSQQNMFIDNSAWRVYDTFSTVWDDFSNDYAVRIGQAGATLRETSTTGSPTSLSITTQCDSSWDCNSYSCEVPCPGPPDKDGNPTETTCPSTCYETCSHDATVYSSTGEGSRSATAIVKIPYNYEQHAAMDEDNHNDIVYAGEEEEFNFTVYTDPFQNDVTDGEYATLSPNAQFRFVVTNEDTGQVYGRSNPEIVRPGGMNPSSDLDGDDYSRRGQIVIPDVAAGTRICIGVEAWPENSGFYDMTGNGNNRFADPDNVNCYTVAKRPSLQIWGGNVYSRGGIETAFANKRNVGISNYFTASVSGYGHHIFGSWGELGVIANGGVPWFASGASTGYASGNNNLKSNGRWPAANSPFGAGGSSSTNFASRSKLTISNTPEIGKIGANNNTNKAANDKEAIINMLASATAGNSSAYEYHDGNFTLDGNVINVGGFTKTIRVDGDLTITGNLTYSGSYVALADVPKLILYAKNINISCTVTRVDALLIADGTVDTCTDTNGNSIYNTNDPRLSRQLVINGAVVANELIPSRTYGAATGSESITPAEIINFDPTLYRFGNSTRNSTDDSTGRLEVTYIRELAPRK